MSMPPYVYSGAKEVAPVKKQGADRLPLLVAPGTMYQAHISTAYDIMQEKYSRFDEGWNDMKKDMPDFVWMR